MSPRRTRRAFRPAVDGLPARIAPTVFLPPPTFPSEQPTAPRTGPARPSAPPTDSLQPTAPTSTC